MNLRLHLQPTTRTDVLCIACCRYQAQLVAVRVDGTETDSGVHKGCAPEIGVKFTRRRAAA